MKLFAIALRRERGGLIGWSIGLFLLMLIVGASYLAIKDDAEAFEDLFENFAGFEEGLGVDSFTTPDGYLRSQAIALFPLLLGIYGGLAATKAIAGAEERGLLDHLLARPISRTQHMASHMASLATGQGAILLASALGIVVGYAVAGLSAEVLGRSVLMTIEVLPIALAHLSLAFLITAHFHRRGPANGIILAVVIGGFVIDLVAKLVDSMAWLEYLTPYGWWSRSDLYHGEPDLLYLLASLLLTVGAAALAVWRFERRDIY